MDAIEIAEWHGDQLVKGALAEKNQTRRAAYALQAVKAYERAIDHSDTGTTSLYEKGVLACDIADAARNRFVPEKSGLTTIAELIEKSDINVTIAAIEAALVSVHAFHMAEQIGHYVRKAQAQGYITEQEYFDYMRTQREFGSLLEQSIEMYSSAIPMLAQKELKRDFRNAVQQFSELRRQRAEAGLP